MTEHLHVQRRATGPDLLPAESSAPGHIVRAIGLAPGAPIPTPRQVVRAQERISIGRLFAWLPLFLPVLLVNVVFSVPPLLLWRDALRQTAAVFFGDDARLPWER